MCNLYSITASQAAITESGTELITMRLRHEVIFAYGAGSCLDQMSTNVC